MVKENKRQSKKYPDNPIDLSPDPNTNTLISKILDRDKEGMDKFGLTMRQVMLKDPNDCKRWLNDALEESIDHSRYLIEAILSYQNLAEENKKLKKEIKKLKEHNRLLYEHP
jgi:hemoglobin-like flavoprotein